MDRIKVIFLTCSTPDFKVKHAALFVTMLLFMWGSKLHAQAEISILGALADQLSSSSNYVEAPHRLDPLIPSKIAPRLRFYDSTQVGEFDIVEKPGRPSVLPEAGALQLDFHPSPPPMGKNKWPRTSDLSINKSGCCMFDMDSNTMADVLANQAKHQSNEVFDFSNSASEKAEQLVSVANLRVQEASRIASMMANSVTNMRIVKIVGDSR